MTKLDPFASGPTQDASDVPDFGRLYKTSPITPRMAARLWSTAEVMYDEAMTGAVDELIDQLPPIARLHADDTFTTAFVSRVAVIARRIACGLEWPESVATCTADEMAIHLVVGSARAFYEGWDPEWIETLPARPDEDEDFSWLTELLLQDTDVLLLFNPALDGIEDPDSELSQLRRLVNLHPADWFKPFPSFA